MGKKIGIAVACNVFLLVFIAVLTYGVYDRINLPQKTVQKLYSSIEESEKTEYNTEISDNVQEAAARIMEYGTKKFFKGYPVDEGFISWIDSAYGDEVLKSLADELESGNTDSGLWYSLTGNTMHVLWAEYARATGYSSYACDNIVWKEVADPASITIDFIGDINFSDSWHTMETAGDSEGVKNCISEEIRTELQSADITMVNNEFAYTTDAEPLEGKDYTFSADPANVDLLDLFGTDIVSIANNHVFDYGEQGFLDTIETLKDHGTLISGGGNNIEEASEARYFIIGGRKISIVSATEIERYSNYTRPAGEDTPGVLKTQQEKALKSAIKTAKKNSDYVIVYVHWGTEGKNNYGADQKELAELIAAQGVDAIIGGHPHRLQGVSFIDDVPVVYSLGNFWFSTGTLYTAIAQLRIDSEGELTLSMLPCIQQGVKTYMCETDEEQKGFYQYMADISTNVGIDENGRFYSYKDVDETGNSLYIYTSGRRYGLHPDDLDLEQNSIDIVGNT
jgi:poly-gamma-glutamate synthesis protein (capsule biosynthesis protein)